jgi:hypothetical protein
LHFLIFCFQIQDLMEKTLFIFVLIAHVSSLFFSSQIQSRYISPSFPYHNTNKFYNEMSYLTEINCQTVLDAIKVEKQKQKNAIDSQSNSRVLFNYSVFSYIEIFIKLRKRRLYRN